MLVSAPWGGISDRIAGNPAAGGKNQGAGSFREAYAGRGTLTGLLPRSAPVVRTVKILQGAEFPEVMKAKQFIFEV